MLSVYIIMLEIDTSWKKLAQKNIDVYFYWKNIGWQAKLFILIETFSFVAMCYIGLILV